MMKMAIPTGWTTAQLDAAEDAIERLQLSGGAFSMRTLLVVAFEAMAAAGQITDVDLVPMDEAKLRALAMQHDPDWHAFGRAVEAAHGIADDDIPF